MLSRGEIWPQTRPGSHSGGMVDTALQRYVQKAIRSFGDRPRQGTLAAPPGPGAAERAGATWSGQDAFNPFLAAAITYLPLIYLPQTVAIWAAEALDLSIESTIFLARELNAITAIGVAVAGLAAWPIPGAVVMLLLVLPKTLLHLASHSPDPIYFALVIAMIGLICRASRPGAPRRVWPYAVIAAALLIVCPVRPPAAALALPAFWLAWRQRASFGAVLIAGALALAAVWTLAILNSTVTDACSNEGLPLATKIVGFFRAGPTLIPQTFLARWRYYLISGVGELGWGGGPDGLTNPLPAWIYAAAAALFALAAAVDMTSPFAVPAGLRAAFAAAVAVMTVTIFLALYVTCWSDQQTIVRGIQGRYFVPVMMVLMPVLSGLIGPRPAWRRLYGVGCYGFALAGFGTLVGEGLRIYWLR